MTAGPAMGIQECDAPACSVPRSVVTHPRPFWCRIDVTGEHSSRAVNHVANTQYVHWLDRIAELHADSLGYTRGQMLESGSMWFVARHEINYLAEVHPGDTLLAATWVRDMGRVKSWRDSAILRMADDAEPTVVCRAATLWVFVNLASRRPMRVPADMARVFDPLDALIPTDRHATQVEFMRGDA